MAIIVDFSGISIASIFMMKGQAEEGLIRHMILNSLRMYNHKYRKDYGEMIIACDGGAGWRKQIFPEYKAHRQKTRDDSGFDWIEIFRIINLVEQEIKDNLPYKILRVPGCEADDIIGVLVEHFQEFGNYQPCMIVSSDRDFIQLQRHSGVKQFSPMMKKLLDEKNPVQYLREKILRGDGGDGVPNVLSPDNTFTAGLRQNMLSQKKVKELIDNWDNLSTFASDTVYKNFLRNYRMIDLTQVPAGMVQVIINNYETAQVKSNILNYLISKRCHQLIECAEEFNTLK